jgi:hypothetical protein
MVMWREGTGAGVANVWVFRIVLQVAARRAFEKKAADAREAVRGTATGRMPMAGSKERQRTALRTQLNKKLDEKGKLRERKAPEKEKAKERK